MAQELFDDLKPASGLLKSAKKGATGIGRFAKGMKWGSAVMPGLIFLGGVSQYKEDTERGDSPWIAAPKAIVQTAAYNAFFLPIMAVQIAQQVPMINQQIQNNIASVQRNMQSFGPRGWQDSEYAQTSRQRALEAIQASRMNARQYIGSESSLFATRYK